MKVLVNGQLINYSDEGTGRIILLLHGWGVDLSTFDQLAKQMSKTFRVIRLDFPGFGNSPKPAGNWKVADYAKMTADFLEKLKVSDLYAIVAHSFGGRIVIKAVSEKLINPEKVVLIGAAGVKPAQSIKKALYKFVAKLGKAVTSLPIINKLQPILKKRLYAAAGSSDYLKSAEMKKIFLNVISEDLLAYVPKIIQPTLLIWGENDSETPLTDANKILKLLPNGSLKVVSNASHFVYIDEPQQILAEMDGFLK